MYFFKFMAWASTCTETIQIKNRNDTCALRNYISNIKARETKNKEQNKLKNKPKPRGRKRKGARQRKQRIITFLYVPAAGAQQLRALASA
jgi:hypothetical protein